MNRTIISPFKPKAYIVTFKGETRRIFPRSVGRLKAARVTQLIADKILNHVESVPEATWQSVQDIANHFSPGDEEE